MAILLNLLLLAVGLVLLIKGADFFVDGASSVAHAMKIPSLIIGLTLVSIGTSAPELSVSVNSAIAGVNDICFGNVIGSNVFNTFVVIGASTLFVSLTLSREMKLFDIPILCGIYLVTAFVTFVTTPGKIDRIEGAILLVLFVSYIVYLILRTIKSGAGADEDSTIKTRKWYLNLLLIGGGLAMIIFGGDLVVDNASALATACGMSELMVGLTIVAIGTSLPELVTSMIAAKKGEHDIAIGNAIGSNLFNVTFILGTSAVIHPVSVEMSAIVDYLAMLTSVVLVWVFAAKTNKVNRWQGIAMIAVYAVYMVYVVLRGLV